MKENILGTESIGKLFLQYSIPTIAAMLFLGLNTIVDGLFVGRYIGADALASVNIAMPFSSFLFALSVIIGIGAQSLIGRKLGAGSAVAANTAFTTAVVLAGGVSLLFTAAAILFPVQIAYFLGANEHLMPQVAAYIRYLGLFLPFLALMMVLDYALKTVAMPVYAMLALVIAVGSHMLFNWLLIAKFALGIKGAAFATGIGFIIAFAMAVLPFFAKKAVLKPFAGSFDKHAAGHILYSGLSGGLSEMGTGITTFLFNITLMRYVGEIGVAAFTVISYLAFMGNNVLIGLSDGVGAIISYNYGSRQIERVKKALQLVSVAAFVIGVGIFMAIFIFSKEVIAMFLNEGNEAVLAFAVYGAKLYAFAFLVNGLNIVVAGYFTAIGSPKKAVFIALSKGLLWIAAGIAVLPVLFGIQGIWLTVPIAEIVTVVLSGFLLHRHFKHQIVYINEEGKA
ncbi:putative membrane protein [Propionispora sp. 2/2-37]|uniref:MATE family efflux transporter n=1 Tax=Propionispora sp. 2/2-37 TaxID=1677858 RepID=UPI0006BB711D|nr:MATE family efflux transporter [Propionispora sp. 2/2-37]CUH95338.1 putative membrane protein [Propionispora sp. 2/2-37]